MGLVNRRFLRRKPKKSTNPTGSKTLLRHLGKCATILCMKTLSIDITDVEYNKFGITENVLSFSDFVTIVSKKLMQENIEAVISAAEKYGLSSMSMEDITAEVKAVRQNAKNCN